MLSRSSPFLAVLMCSRTVIGDFLQDHLTDTYVELQTYAAGVNTHDPIQILYMNSDDDSEVPFDYFLSKQTTYDADYNDDHYAVNVDSSSGTNEFTLVEGKAALYAPQLPAEGELASVISVVAKKHIEVDLRTTASVGSLQVGDVVVVDTTAVYGRRFEWFDGSGTQMGGWGDSDYSKGNSRVFLEIEEWTDMSSFTFSCFESYADYCHVHNHFYVYRPSTLNAMNGKMMMRLEPKYLTWTKTDLYDNGGCEKPTLEHIEFDYDPYAYEEEDDYYSGVSRFVNKAWHFNCGDVINPRKPDAQTLQNPHISSYAFDIPGPNEVNLTDFVKPVIEVQFMSEYGESVHFALYDEDNNMIFSFEADYDSSEVLAAPLSIPADGLIRDGHLRFKLMTDDGYAMYMSPYVLISDANSNQAAGYFLKNLDDEDVVWGPMMQQSASRSQVSFNESEYDTSTAEDKFVYYNYFGQVTHRRCPNYLDVETGLFDPDVNTFISASTWVDDISWGTDNSDRLDFVMEGMWQPRIDYLIPENCTLEEAVDADKLSDWNSFDFEGYYVEFPIPDRVKEIGQDTIIQYEMIDIDSDRELAWAAYLLDESGGVVKEYLVMESETEDDNWGVFSHEFSFTASEIAAASSFKFQKKQLRYPYMDNMDDRGDTVWDIKDEEIYRFRESRVWMPYIKFHSNAPAPTSSPSSAPTEAPEALEESYSSAHRPVVSILMFALAVAAVKFQ